MPLRLICGKVETEDITRTLYVIVGYFHLFSWWFHFPDFHRILWPWIQQFVRISKMIRTYTRVYQQTVTSNICVHTFTLFCSGFIASYIVLLYIRKFFTSWYIHTFKLNSLKFVFHFSPERFLCQTQRYDISMKAYRLWHHVGNTTDIIIT